MISAYDRVKLLNEENLQIAFNMLDENKDGKISKSELVKVIGESVCDNLGMHSIDMSEETWNRLI